MTEPLVLSEPGRVWRLTLNRPDARNAVSAGMIEALHADLSQAADDTECRVVLLSGTGRDFCSGADVGELLAAREGSGTIDYGRSFEGLLRAIEDHPVPVVAAAHGAALGAGCQLLLACDLVIAADDARIGIPSARLGIVIPFENVQRLVIAVGPKRTAEMLLAGRVLTGREAKDWGLVNETAARDVVEAGAEVAERVASLAPMSVGASKRGIREAVSGLVAGQGSAA
ncbi:MAG: enoyl-CoA hydratase/isomerase family protein, partial [Actinomycetota bacterium]